MSLTACGKYLSTGSIMPTMARILLLSRILMEGKEWMSVEVEGQNARCQRGDRDTHNFARHLCSCVKCL